MNAKQDCNKDMIYLRYAIYLAFQQFIEGWNM
jgi:hypothetical protein